MAQTRIYGSSFSSFGAAIPFANISFLSSGLIGSSGAPTTDGQSNGDFIYGNHNVGRAVGYAIPDTAIPDTASSVSVDFTAAAMRDTGSGTNIAAFRGDGTNNTAWISLGSYDSSGFSGMERDGLTTAASGALLTGALFKSNYWGVQWTPIGGVTSSVNRIAVRVIFTLPSPSSVTTNAATAVGPGSATLNGSFSPNGATSTYPVSYKFEYGLTTAYGTSSSTTAGQTGTSTITASTGISGLTVGTLYHFRLVTSNADVTVNGADQTFVTGGLDDGFSL